MISLKRNAYGNACDAAGIDGPTMRKLAARKLQVSAEQMAGTVPTATRPTKRPAPGRGTLRFYCLLLVVPPSNARAFLRLGRRNGWRDGLGTAAGDRLFTAFPCVFTAFACAFTAFAVFTAFACAFTAFARVSLPLVR